MSSSSRLKLKLKLPSLKPVNITVSLSHSLYLSLSLFAHNASALAELVEIKSRKMFEIHVVSNSQFIVFYRERSHTTIYGNVTNWSSAGYWDLAFEPASKFRVKF
jgi:hypothetical protein